MPEQRTGEPTAKRDGGREGEVEQRRGVVDLPARHDHHNHRDRVDPMRDPHPDRMDQGLCGTRLIVVERGCGHDGEPTCLAFKLSELRNENAGVAPGVSSHCRQPGNRTVSTTWITPLDWSTSPMVTIDLPPLASVTESLPGPACSTVRVSPATVLNMALPPPSLTAFIRLEAVRRPGTT